MLVKINAHVYAYFEYANPVYRYWINDTLYNEREFWTDCRTNYIMEEIHLKLDPGEHTFTIEKVPGVTNARIWIEKFDIIYDIKHISLDFPINPQNKQIIKFEIE